MDLTTRLFKSLKVLRFAYTKILLLKVQYPPVEVVLGPLTLHMAGFGMRHKSEGENLTKRK